jgi:hypothetical protein
MQDMTYSVSRPFLKNNQLDASISFSIFIYFQLSTCFEPFVSIIRRGQIVLTQLLVTVTPCWLQYLVMVWNRLYSKPSLDTVAVLCFT